MSIPGKQHLAALFPDTVATAWSDDADNAGELLPVELDATTGMVPKRLREYRHGRHCARQALAELGHHAVAIPKRADRSPGWPAGFRGSITHCGELAAAAVAREADFRGIGLDIELAGALSEDIRALVCRPDEDHTGPLTKLVFCAKEAIYKCLYPEVQAYFDFQDMEVRITEADAVSGMFTAVPHTDAFDPELATSLQGRYRLNDEWIIAAACLTA